MEKDGHGWGIGGNRRACGLWLVDWGLKEIGGRGTKGPRDRGTKGPKNDERRTTGEGFVNLHSGNWRESSGVRGIDPSYARTDSHPSTLLPEGRQDRLPSNLSVALPPSKGLCGPLPERTNQRKLALQAS